MRKSMAQLDPQLNHELQAALLLGVAIHHACKCVKLCWPTARALRHVAQYEHSLIASHRIAALYQMCRRQDGGPQTRSPVCVLCCPLSNTVTSQFDVAKVLCILATWHFNICESCTIAALSVYLPCSQCWSSCLGARHALRKKRKRPTSTHVGLTTGNMHAAHA